MAIIFGTDFITLAAGDISARTTSGGWVASNVLDRFALKRRHRADDYTKDDWLHKISLGSPTTVAAAYLSDVTYSKVKIQGNDADSWGAPSYNDAAVTLSQNPWTGRYQGYIPLTAFSHSYLRTYIPADATVVGTGNQYKWETGVIVLLSSVTELTTNMAIGSSETTRDFYVDAGNERYEVNPTSRFQCKIVFGNRALTEKTELLAINRARGGQPFLYFKNEGDYSEAYLCVRDDNLEFTETGYNDVTANAVSVRECYRIGDK